MTEWLNWNELNWKINLQKRTDYDSFNLVLKDTSTFPFPKPRDCNHLTIEDPSAEFNRNQHHRQQRRWGVRNQMENKPKSLYTGGDQVDNSEPDSNDWIFSTFGHQKKNLHFLRPSPRYFVPIQRSLIWSNPFFLKISCFSCYYSILFTVFYGYMEQGTGSKLGDQLMVSIPDKETCIL